MSTTATEHWLIPDHAVDVHTFALADGRELKVLRDDLIHPLVGGNKLRKLDGMLPELRERGVTDVLTCGGVQSSHTTAVAVSCAELGMRSHVLLRGERLEVPTGYALLTQVYAHSTTFVRRGEYADRRRMFESHAQRIGETLGGSGIDHELAIVPEGATSVAGMRGLVRLVGALAETLGHEAARLPHILVVDSGTGTTATGLALGCALHGLPWRVHGVMLVPDGLANYQRTAQRLVHGWERAYGPIVLAGNRLRWVPRKNPRRFGKLIDDEIARCVGISRATGMPIDPIYTLAAWDYCMGLPDAHLDLAIMVHTGGGLNMMGIAQRRPQMPGLPASDESGVTTAGRGMPAVTTRTSTAGRGLPKVSQSTPRLLATIEDVAGAATLELDVAEPAEEDAPPVDGTVEGWHVEMDSGVAVSVSASPPEPPPPVVVTTVVDVRPDHASARRPPALGRAVEPAAASPPPPPRERPLPRRPGTDPSPPGRSNNDAWVEIEPPHEPPPPARPESGAADLVADLERVLNSSDLPIVD